MTPHEAFTYLRGRPEARLVLASLDWALRDPGTVVANVRIEEDEGMVFIEGEGALGPIRIDAPLAEIGEEGFWVEGHDHDGTHSLLYSENIRHGVDGASEAVERFLRGERP